ncbi:hypothetical protein MJA45_16485 [Paenibacillus aurantius]|uniref:Uncharacterized protein n=1 Tax=Paenibacillus aurantius TaxID=2918900 RepID=A0AA96RDB4_9BACL|nr:hypothetical protein [Paenibacillus aurantius]WNQ09236.1 hypothetical protein MJA45_16485 [Paenibacillus aurantius]
MTAKRIHLKNHGGSLFYRLLASFVAIITLLVSLHLITYSFFRSSIKEEIIHNSSLNLNSTVTNYEKHIKLIKGFLIGLSVNDRTEVLKRSTQHFNYSLASQQQLELQRTMNNSLLFLQDVALYFADIQYVIDQFGTREAKTMFTKLYQSDFYPESFWQEELKRSFTFRLYPAADYKETNAFYTTFLGRLMPIIVKQPSNPQFGIIGFLDSDRLYEQFHPVKTNGLFYILDESGSLLYSSNGTLIPDNYPTGSPDPGYFLLDNNYYFTEKGPETGYTYISVVPFADISHKILRLNVITITVLLASLFVGVAVSVFFSTRFHNPILAILQSIQSMHPTPPLPKQSPIKEYNLISEKLQELFLANEHIHKDLHTKNSLLQQYSYLSKTKRIHPGFPDKAIPVDSTKPFQLILYDLKYKERFVSEMGMDQSRASNYIMEFISSLFSQCSDSLTFQIEKDQIITLVFGEDQDRPELTAILDKVERILRLDVQYCDVTIAVSPTKYDPLELNPAFEHAQDLLTYRKLGEGVQVINSQEEQLSVIWLSASEEKEFAANLVSGNLSFVIPFVNRILERAAKKQATLTQIYDLSLEMTNLVIKTMYSMSIPLPHLEKNAPPASFLRSAVL